LAERLQSLSGLRSSLSTSFIETSLFTWLRKRFERKEVNPSFTAFLVAQAGEAVETITLWTPVAYLEIEIPIQISRSELRPLSKRVIDEWEGKIAALSSEQDRDSLVELFNRLRKDFQGLAAVVTKVEAEPDRASEIALEEAERITSVLGICSEAILTPDIKCVSRIKGSEHLRECTTILEFEADAFQVHNKVLEGSPVPWRLTKKDIADFRSVLLDKVSRLLAADSMSEFGVTVLNSILLYSKAAFTSDPVEKLVYMLSALESVLLKNENEPIQQNLAERLAIFTERGLEARKRIIKIVKSVYSVRSRYLHHGHLHSELELIKEFMYCVWIFFTKLVAHAECFSTKDDFIGTIDDHKLG